MTEPDKEGRAEARGRHAVSRTVYFYALLIAALMGINVLMYWERGSRLNLVVAGIAGATLVGYIVYARGVLRAR